MIDVKTGEVIEFVDDEIEKLQHAIAERLGEDDPGDETYQRQVTRLRETVSKLPG